MVLEAPDHGKAEIVSANSVRTKNDEPRKRRSRPAITARLSFGNRFAPLLRPIQSMRTLKQLFENNRQWADELLRDSPDLLKGLAEGQQPGYMWIGCSDSRVPANQLLGVPAGEVFVYRNIANQAQPDDPGIAAALYYGVVLLKVRHILLCGHYGCGGVRATLDNDTPGPLDPWLQPLKVTAEKYRDELNAIEPDRKRYDRLSELNVVEQVRAIAGMEIVRDAWANGQPLDIHGWMFQVATGRLHDLNLCVSNPTDADALCDQVAEKS